MITAKEIVEKIRNCYLNDKKQWLQIDNEVDIFLETAKNEDIKYLNNHWAEMELLNNIAFGYKMKEKTQNDSYSFWVVVCLISNAS